jgi:hypothetical protein
MVNFARCKCLGANVLRGPDQIPWDGKLKYDYQLWINSDIVFDVEKFYRLVWMDKQIAAYLVCLPFPCLVFFGAATYSSLFASDLIPIVVFS